MDEQANIVERVTASGAQLERLSRLDRVSLGGGVAAAVLFLAGTALFIFGIVPDLPPLDAPAAERAAFYARMSRSGLYRSVSYLGQLQMMMLLLFSGGLFGLLRRAEGGSGALSGAVFAAGIALALITPVMILIEDHLMLGFAAAGVDPVIVAEIDGLVPRSYAMGGFPQALVAGGSAALLLPQRHVPRWIGWFAVAVAALSLVSTGMLIVGALFPLAVLAMLLFRVWLLAFSVALLRRGVHPVRASDDAPAMAT